MIVDELASVPWATVSIGGIVGYVAIKWVIPFLKQAADNQLATGGAASGLLLQAIAERDKAMARADAAEARADELFARLNTIESELRITNFKLEQAEKAQVELRARLEQLVKGQK